MTHAPKFGESPARGGAARPEKRVTATHERLHFALLPTSWTFHAGSRIRLSISGADADHFAQVPHGRPPLIRVFHGPDHDSRLTLPWRGMRGGHRVAQKSGGRTHTKL
jgi:predicted acyl esterase